MNDLNFDLPKNRSSVIKVIGVGGGGSNAVNHMKRQGIHGVDFIVCNTDAQALAQSPVENKIQLGASLTEGLGAGANPDVGERAAVESFDEIQAMLSSNTKMVFITAGMGGGTGTGAAPIIAKAAKEMGILTVAIVTAPFVFEGNKRMKQAEAGIESLKDSVDSLIVINNNKLREIYGNLGFKSGFGKADEVLATAAKGIAEVITNHFNINIDLHDAKTVLHNSGTAIMGSYAASGPDRALQAITGALDSPLLNDNHIHGARNVLLLIVSGANENEVTFDEIGEINDYIQEKAGHQVDIIMGMGEDRELGNSVQVTVVATGFNASNPVGELRPPEPERIIHDLDTEDRGDQPVAAAPEQPIAETPAPAETPETPEDLTSTAQFDLFQAVEQPLPDNTMDARLAQEEATMEFSDMPLSQITEPEAAPEAEAEDLPAHEVPVSETESESTDIVRMTLDWDESDDIRIDSEFLAEEPVEEATPEVVAPIEDATAPEAIETSFEAEEDDPFGFELNVIDLDAVDEAPVATDDVTEIALDQVDSFTVDEPVVMEEPVASEDSMALEDISVAEDAQEAGAIAEDMATAEEAETTKDIRSFTLDDLQAMERELLGEAPAKATAEPAAEPAADLDQPSEALQAETTQAFELKTVEVASKETLEIDPERHSVDESTRKLQEARRNYLTQFTHTFNSNLSRINMSGNDDEPAYERQGTKVDTHVSYSTRQANGDSGISSSGNDVEFRSHNSFLHDNVD